MVAEYYPRPHDPVSGLWAHRQALAARAAGADVRVLVLDRPLPPIAAVRAGPRTLARAVHDVAAVPPRSTLDGIEVEYVRYLSAPRERSYARWHLRARRPLERALERLRARWPFDLVHAHYALPAGGAVRAYAARRRLPLIVSVHGGDVLAAVLSTPAARATVAAVLGGANLVLCNAEATRRRVSELAPHASATVLHLGTDIPDELPPKRRSPTISTLAHLVPRKRHADVLEAIASLDEVGWEVIGDGPERERLRRMAGALGVAERVSFHGRLAPARALDVLARTHLMVMPSVDEAFGVAYIEALAHGVPAVGCAGEGGPEEIAAAGAGMLRVPPQDSGALARVVSNALADGEGLARLAAAGRATARRHFSWEACGEATVAAYRDALR